MKWFFLPVFVISCFVWSVSAKCEDKVKKQKYVIGVENIAYLPHYDGSKSEYGGYARAVLDLFFKSINADFEYRPLPINRLFKNFVSGELDFKYPDSPDWQKDIKKGKTIVYSDPVSDYIDGIMVKPERKGKGIEALKDLGTVTGFTPWACIDLVKQGKIKLSENNDFAALLRQTINERNDGAYFSVAVALYQLREVVKKPDALVFDPSLPYVKDAYFLSTTKHKDIILKFNEFLKTRNTELSQIKEKLQVNKGL
ncbi:MAG: transporter substrate-binding domain-containing protein [Oligoflexales bacterium]|nr:transporter substrate-binding domain-containing protein [Oligoflexales bacterium]